MLTPKAEKQTWSFLRPVQFVIHFISKLTMTYESIL